MGVGLAGAVGTFGFVVPLAAVQPVAGEEAAPLIPASPIPASAGAGSTSANWSGYAATGGPFQTVSASWVQPTPTCPKGMTSYSAFWVGLDGDTSKSVEQTGSSVDCDKGTAVNYGWYEIYPNAPVDYSNKLQAGDSMTGSVTTSGDGSFTMVLTDVTRGWTQSVVKSYPKAKLSSAEIIAEAPSNGFEVLPLTNYGVVSFTDASVNGSPLSSSNPTKIVMVDNGAVASKPSKVTGGGNFRVTWKHK